MKKSLLFSAFLVFVGIQIALSQVSRETIQRDIALLAPNYQLSPDDVSDFSISDNYTQKNGTSHVYLTQTVNGLAIFNAIFQLHYNAQGELIGSASHFIPNKNSKTNTSKATLSMDEALQAFFKEISIPFPSDGLRYEATDKPNQQLIYIDALVKRPIRASLGYERVNDRLVLAYKFIVEPKAGNDMYNVRIDAVNGQLIKLNNRTLYCEPSHVKPTGSTAPTMQQESPLKLEVNAVYNAFPLGVESPIHGTRQLLSGIESADASPFGWHDTNGATGAEYTITRGNNVFAYEDQADIDAPGYSPDGGNNLSFDFPANFSQDPTLNMDAALTNLFVWNNFMHDVTYAYGFDEESGNFQANNYGNGGIDDDFVHAQGFDGGGINNANFATPEDGFNPIMQMYLWFHDAGNLFTVNSPALIAGSYATGSANFGPQVPLIAITADLVLMQGSTGTASQGCGTATNAAALNGKIALVDRGNCTFIEKALNAQNAGALALVVINNQGGAAPTMGGNDNGQVTIPCISITQSVGNAIKAQMQNGPVNASVGGVVQEYIYDSNFDNGIIAHEYGHGISNRLTGGPSNVDCLQNEEQAGEGWSDFFALALTDPINSTVNDVRGIGNFADNQAANAGGIRPYPYTTNMSINPLTYADVDGLSIPHGVGSVWCTMIWDLYLNLVSIYGHSHDVYATNGGNNIAIQLVMEGMRLQNCEPGFVDARDAILQADMLLYNGVHQCIIWKTFARRGLGLSANQGNTDNVGDETEAFNIPASCSSDVDFYTKQTSTCEGNSIQFQNLVFPVASSFSWSFPGGSPASSIDPNPVVTYPAAGTYQVSLTATNTNGTVTETKQAYITVTQGLNFTINTTVATLGNNNGSASINQVSGSGPYTYSWTGFPNNNTPNLTGLAAGDYSVTVTDLNGCSSTQNFSISSNMGLDEYSNIALHVYPNPASNVLYIQAEKNITAITITDISGKKISQQTLYTTTGTLDIANLSAGLYLLQIQVEGETLVRRFVKK